MQQRVADFLAQVADDAVTLTLLQLNDELNSAFQRYVRPCLLRTPSYCDLLICAIQCTLNVKSPPFQISIGSSES